MKTLKEWLAPLKVSDESNCYDIKAYAYQQLTSSDSHDWLTLASHSNGYVREIAIAMLQAELSKQAMRAILIALNDWVIPVRQQAQEVLASYLKQDCAEQLLANVDKLLALTQRRRADHHSTLAVITHYLQQPQYSAAVQQALLTQTGRYALYVFEILFKIDPRLAAITSMAHKDVFVRYVVVNYHRRFAEPLATLLLTKASKDNNGRVRVAALRLLLPLLSDPYQRCDIIRAALLHPSGVLRNWAIWAARREQIDLLEVANKGYQILKPCKNSWLGLLGLIKDNHLVAAVAIVKHALNSPLQNVRMTALKSLVSLEAADCYEVLTDMLSDESSKVVSYCAKILAEKYSPESLPIIIETANMLATQHQQEHLLQIMRFVPDWQNLLVTLQLADLISVDIRDKLFKQWFHQYPHTLYLPKLSSQLKTAILDKLVPLRKVDPKLKDKIASYLAQ